MAKKMGPLVCETPNASTLERSPGDYRDRATGCKPDAGSARAEKQPATRRLGSAITQVSDDSGADIWRNRHPCALPALDVNEHLAGSPIDIIQCKCRDLAGPQAEPGQHYEYGVVPPPSGACAIATIENILHLFGRQIGRQVRKLPFSDRGQAAVEKDWVQPFMMKVSEKCAQRRAHDFPRLRTPVPGVTFDVAHDVGLTDFAEVVGAGGAQLIQKPADLWQMFNDGCRRQAAFSLQIVANPANIWSCGVIGDRAGGAIVPASRSTDSHRFKAIRSPVWIDCFLAR